MISIVDSEFMREYFNNKDKHCMPLSERQRQIPSAKYTKNEIMSSNFFMSLIL